MVSTSVFPREFGDELLLHIFADIPPEDNLKSLQLVCRKFHAVANDQTIWKRHCITSFKFWHEQHSFHEKVANPKPDAVDWKELWLRRRRTNAHLETLFQGILDTKVGRLERFRTICDYGYDAKDFLLEQGGTDDSMEDVLARSRRHVFRIPDYINLDWGDYFVTSGIRACLDLIALKTPLPVCDTKLLRQIFRNDTNGFTPSRVGD